MMYDVFIWTLITLILLVINGLSFKFYGVISLLISFPISLVVICLIMMYALSN